MAYQKIYDKYFKHDTFDYAPIILNSGLLSRLHYLVFDWINPIVDFYGLEFSSYKINGQLSFLSQ